MGHAVLDKKPDLTFVKQHCFDYFTKNAYAT